MADLLTTLEALGNHRTFIRLLKIDGLAETLETQGPYTVFAPIDDAFNELPEETLDSLLAGEGDLKRVLSNHLVLGELTADDLQEESLLESQSGGKILVSLLDDTLMVNDAAVVQPDIDFAGGLVQVIDAVLIPQGS